MQSDKMRISGYIQIDKYYHIRWVPSFVNEWPNTSF